MKKVLGNKGNYFETVKKWVPEEHHEGPVETHTVIGKVARVDVTQDGVHAYVDLDRSVDAKKLVNAIKGMDVKAYMGMSCHKWTDHLRVVKNEPKCPCLDCDRYHKYADRGILSSLPCMDICTLYEDYMKSIKEDN